VQGGHLDIALGKIIADSYFIDAHPGAEAGNYWRLSVKDTGVGMDSRTISKIYDPFFTTKTKLQSKARSWSVNGLFGNTNTPGFIDVYSEVGIGTAFSLYLPVWHGAGEQQVADHASTICHGEGLILVVDDEEVIRDYTKAMLLECGYEVLTAGNGQEGLDLWHRHRDSITAVVMDVVMPVKSATKR
jgi:hypothetical protein